MIITIGAALFGFFCSGVIGFTLGKIYQRKETYKASQTSQPKVANFKGVTTESDAKVVLRFVACGIEFPLRPKYGELFVLTSTFYMYDPLANGRGKTYLPGEYYFSTNDKWVKYDI
jgi:hypothetical protein